MIANPKEDFGVIKNGVTPPNIFMTKEIYNYKDLSPTYPNGKVVGKAFTNRSQLASIAYDGNLMANFQYDAGMRETTRGLGNGLTQTTSYRLDNLIQQKAVAGITNFSYTYDANKRKTSETDAVNTNLSQTFSYDFENEAMKAKFSWLAQPEGQDHGWSQQNRLTLWTSNGTTLNQTQSWSLSLEGAWNSTTVNGNSETRTFNETYETLFSNSNPMSHDRKGNLTTNKDGSVYTWDFDNQLAFSTAGTPSVNAAYAYDALGRRVSKISNNIITVFVHSDYQILTEYKSINGGAFIETQSLVYAAYIDDPIALISTNGTYFYHSNQQFSIGAITDSNGNLSERYGYNAYGKPVVITESILIDNPYYYTGRQLDLETGLLYFRARYYDASLGQFISRDPIGFVDGMNLYRGYFGSNMLDPLGLCICCCCAESIDVGEFFEIDNGTRLGHQFEVKIIIKYIKSDFFGDCKLEWEETTNIGYKVNKVEIKANTPTDMYALDPTNDFFKQWNDRSKICPSDVFIPIVDVPSLAKQDQNGVKRSATRKLTIKITVKSAENCNCEKEKVTLELEQNTSLTGGKKRFNDIKKIE